MVYKKPDIDDEDQPVNSADFEQLLKESFSKNTKKVKVGDKIRAEVLSVGKEQTIVTTGSIHDGFVPTSHLLDEKSEPKVKAGDTIDLFVTYVRGSQIFLSPNPGAKNLAEDIQDAYEKGLSIEGKVESVNTGGLKVIIMGKEAFCPISQIDTKRVEKPEEYIGKKFEFKISQITEGGRNVVVSRRRALEEGEKVAQASFAEQRKVGDIVNGIVTRLEKFGAFVELMPGLEGLAHISELAWSRVNDPNDILEIGQPVSAKILKIEREDQRLKISLSLKQSENEPWQNLPSEVQAGKVLPGKVTRCVKFGAFVELYPGIEGLIPMSEMSYTKRIAKSDELIKEGERITVMVKDVDPQAKRISLSLKDAGEDPWARVPDKYPVGTLLQAKLEKREAFGLFLQLEEGITGLLPKSRALQSSDFPYDRLKPGESVLVKVAEIRPSERRISLDLPEGNGAEEWKTYQAAQMPKAAASMGVFGARLQAALERGQNKK